MSKQLLKVTSWRGRKNFKSFIMLCYFNICIRVRVQGVESLWGDCRFIPADRGLYSMICAFCSFWRLFTRKMIIFFLKKGIFYIFFYFIKIKPPALTCKMAAKWFNSLDTNSNMYTYAINQKIRPWKDAQKVMEP